MCRQLKVLTASQIAIAAKSFTSGDGYLGLSTTHRSANHWNLTHPDVLYKVSKTTTRLSRIVRNRDVGQFPVQYGRVIGMILFAGTRSRLVTAMSPVLCTDFAGDVWFKRKSFTVCVCRARLLTFIGDMKHVSPCWKNNKGKTCVCAHRWNPSEKNKFWTWWKQNRAPNDCLLDFLCVGGQHTWEARENETDLESEQGEFRAHLAQEWERRIQRAASCTPWTCGLKHAMAFSWH